MEIRKIEPLPNQLENISEKVFEKVIDTQK